MPSFGPEMIPFGSLFVVGVWNSVMTPAGVAMPILSPLNSVNQMFLSGPAWISTGSLPPVGIGYSVKFVPLVEILAILFEPASVNHMNPSEPLVTAVGELPGDNGYSVTTPLVVIFPMFWPLDSANHKFPSIPAVMPST